MAVVLHLLGPALRHGATRPLIELLPPEELFHVRLGVVLVLLVPGLHEVQVVNRLKWSLTPISQCRNVPDPALGQMVPCHRPTTTTFGMSLYPSLLSVTLRPLNRLFQVSRNFKPVFQWLVHSGEVTARC